MQLDISNLAYVAGSVLGIGEFGGGVFCTMALYTALTGVMLYVAKSQNIGVSLPILVVEGLLVVAFCTAIGWVGYWLLAFIGLGLLGVIILKGLGGFNN